MPIDLTTVPEDGGSHQRRRRRRHKQRRHSLLAVIAGLLTLAIFGGGFYLYNYTNAFSPSVTSTAGLTTRMGASTVTGAALTAEKAVGPVTVVSAPAVTSGELPPETARARILTVRRVIGADGSNDLEVSYEFASLARAPKDYTFAIRVGNNIGRVAFPADAARSNVVRFGKALQRLGSTGPIDLWIETLAPANERISNVMTIQ